MNYYYGRMLARRDGLKLKYLKIQTCTFSLTDRLELTDRVDYCDVFIIFLDADDPLVSK